MALPTGYTAESFANYIKRDVLQYVADSMDWYIAPPQPFTPDTRAVNLKADSFLNQGYIDIDEENTLGASSTFYIQGGNTLVFVGDPQEYTVGWVSPAPGGGTRIKIFPYLQVDKTDGDDITITNTITPRVTDPTYGYIMDEALAELGLSDISNVNSSNILLFRLFARVQAWRFVASNTASMTSNEEQANFYQREQVFQSAIEQLRVAEMDLEDAQSAGSSVNSGQAVSTVMTKVKVRW
jgi:hypothetical protein